MWSKMTMVARCVSFYLAWMLYESVSGATLEDIKNLKTKLFAGYDRYIRPVRNQSVPVVVNVTFVLSMIDNLDLITQKLKWNGYLKLEWYDQELAWNSKDYGGLEFLTPPQSEIWLPDIVIGNDLSPDRTLGSSDTLVFLRSDGHVTWEPGMVKETSCKIDIRKYPFDEQKCVFKFVPWMTTRRGLTTRTVLDKIELSNYARHGEFEVSGTSASYRLVPMTFIDDELMGINFTISLSRRPTFYWLIMIFPMMTFPLLCPISFLIPVECGEKITLSITVVLSFLVFIGSMNDAMPKLSDTVSLLLVYSSVQTTISMLSVIANGIIICVSKLPADFTFNLHVCAIRRPTRLQEKTKYLQTIFRSLHNVAKIQKHDVKKEQNAEMEKEKSLKSAESNKWIQIARNMDKICFLIFIALPVIVSLIFAFLIL